MIRNQPAFKPSPMRWLAAALLAAALSWLAAVRSGFAPGAPAPADEVANEFFITSTMRTGSSTQETIAALQNHLQQNPQDAMAFSQLGAAYLQRARETGDPSYYQKAESTLTQALSLEPGDYAALYAMGLLELARHQFRAGLAWGERARQANPDRSYAYGVIADAQIELGLYDQAAESLQRMVDLRPDMSAYARISYLRELHGDLPGALELMQWAADSGSATGENTAWTRVQLANLYFNTGDLQQAEREFLRTLQIAPDYVFALAGLARVRAAQERRQEAQALLEKAVRIMPQPEFIIALYELYDTGKERAAAQEQLDLLAVIQTLYRSNGVDLDLEMALFNADLGNNAQATVQQARLAYSRRPSVYAADVLAWALYQAGEYQEAQEYSKLALRLGSRDALKLFHAGMIAYRLGQQEQALRFLQDALSANPHFSLRYAPQAQQIVEKLK